LIVSRNVLKKKREFHLCSRGLQLSPSCS